MRSATLQTASPGISRGSDAGSTTPEQSRFQPSIRRPKYAPDRLLVRFRRGVSKVQADASHARVAVTSVTSSKVLKDLHVVRLRAGVPLLEALSAYRSDPAVLYAEPDWILHHAQVTPGDPHFPELWGLDNSGQTGGTPDADIDAPEAWQITTGSNQVVVGVIDSGVDYLHEDLVANMFRNPLDCNSNGVDDDANGHIDDCHGIDTFNGDSDPIDDNGHGTHVSGTIGAAGGNGIGVVGVNWNVQIIACKFLGGQGFGFASGAVACLDYLADLKDRGVNLVATNNSWGGGSFSQALLDAIDAHRQRGILFIAVAGNNASDNDSDTFLPANYDLPNVISVAATDHNDALVSFSNFGRRSVHLGAPGENILSTFPNDNYRLFSGTSMAAPHVTGVAALLAAQDGSRDWRAIKNLILAGGDIRPSVDPTISQRRLNAHGSMNCSNSAVLSWLQVPPTAFPGQPVTLSVLHINCAAPNGDVLVTVSPGGASITLLDDGVGSDQQAGDGIYSSQWLPSATGLHTLTISGGAGIGVQVLAPYRFSATAFSYRNISGTGIVLHDDDSALIASPFPIPFGGGSFSNLFVNSNGNVTFTGPFPPVFLGGKPIPTDTTPTLVAALWEDLFPTFPVEHVFWDVQGVAPNRELIVEWRDVEHFLCDDPSLAVKFQIVFFEASPNILFNYADVFFGGQCTGFDRGRLATVGVQVTRHVGTQFSHNTPNLADGLALLWELGHPAPTLAQLSPFTAIAGDLDFTLRVLGTNFVPGSVVRWNSSARPASFVSSSELRLAVAAADIASPASVQISVFNPAPGGGASGQLSLDIHASHPVPVLASVTEVGQRLIAGVPNSVTLDLTGSSFVTGSVARWNGSDRETTALNQSKLTAVIPPSDFTVPGAAEITVFNPLPGGGTSNVISMQIENPVPDVCACGNTFLRAGDPDTSLRVEGNGFNATSIVRWNGQDRPTTFVDFNRLDVSLTAADIAVPGTAQITVFNPPPAGGLSNAITIQIISPLANDNFADAIDISSLPLPFFHLADTRVASTEASDPFPSCLDPVFLIFGDGRANSIWYKYTASQRVGIHVQTVGEFNHTSPFSVLSVWTGAPGSFTEVGCMQDNPILGQDAQAHFAATPGTTYFFMVSESAENREFFFDVVAPPPNDDFSSATVISSTPFTAVLDTAGAISDPADPVPCGSESRDRSVWFQFTPAADLSVTADTAGSDYSTILSVWTGSHGAFAPVVCHVAIFEPSRVTFKASAGVTYSFMVSRQGGIFPGSTLVFHVTPSQVLTTTIALGSSQNPADLGQSVTFTATVTPSAATGIVDFLDGNTVLGSGTLSNGSASFSTSALASGSHSITASYLGDANHAATSSSALMQTIRQSSSVTLSSSLNPSNTGQSVTFAATVSPAAATGSVTFLEGNTTLATGTLANGMATFSTSALTAGSHSIAASYAGDANIASSSSAPLTQVVDGISVAPNGPTSATVSGGGTANFSMVVSQGGNLPAPVTLSCTGLPSDWNCTFTPPSVPAGSGPTMVALAVRTTSMTSQGIPPAPMWSAAGFSHAWLVVLALFALIAQPRKRCGGIARSNAALVSLALIMMLVGMAACSAGGGTSEPSRTVNVAANAVSGNVTSSTVFMVTVR